MDGMRGLDAWITGGRYSSSRGDVICPCGETTHVTAETEYGSITWTPEECKNCGRVFEGDEEWIDDEPPEPDYEPDWEEVD